MRGFPAHVLPPDTTLWRIHGNAFGPWFFRDDGKYRFDLTDRRGWGTCYFAEDKLGAFVEALQGFRTVALPRAELAARRLFGYRVEHALVVADAIDRAAGAYGVDASISAGSPGHYTASQQFATRAFDAGFAGIRYFVRNDVAQTLPGIALFGPAGPQPDGLLSGVSGPIDEELVADACKELTFRTRGPLLDP